MRKARVYVWKTKHKGNDAWRFAIDQPGAGKLIEPRGRYTRRRNAKRGGDRQCVRLKVVPVVVYGKPPKK